MLDAPRLLNLGHDLKDTYQSADPFPHIVIDNFLPEAVARQAAQSFPNVEDMDFEGYRVHERRIAATPAKENFPDYLKQLLYALNSHEIITFLEVMTGYNGLVADPHYIGGGLHMTLPGGYLKLHADFTQHKHLNLHRRLNLLVYLNEDWQEDWGGHNELWSTDMSECRARVLPIFNRALVFSTLDDSWHGLPDPVKCPAGMARKCLALYYYSTEKSAERSSGEYFWTKHQERPGTNELAAPKANNLAYAKYALTPPIVEIAKRKIFIKKQAIMQKLRSGGRSKAA